MIKKIGIAFLCFFCLTSTAVFASDLPVPRFVSLKDDKVNLRAGPALRFPIKYVYKVQHYPVEVIDEHQLWRQIREIDGTVGWIHKRMLSSNRFVITTSDVDLYASDENGSPIIAHIESNVIGQIDSCNDSHKCEATFDFNNKKITGWLDKTALYGVYQNEIIN